MEGRKRLLVFSVIALPSQLFHFWRPDPVGLLAREVFAKVPEVKRLLWGGEFWGKGYFVNTVGQHGSEKVIAAYVQGQGGKSEYRQLHKGQMDLGLA